MPKNYSIANERTLQHLWAHLCFERTGLSTHCGQPLEIADPGQWNHSDGPDFLGAVIKIGSIYHHGAVELHLDERDWLKHEHQKDVRYEPVILHVVLNVSSGRVAQSPSSVIPVFEIGPHLHPALRYQLAPQHALPCHAHLSLIHPSLLQRQLEAASYTYFEEKLSAIFREWPKQLGLSEAWRRSLLKQLFLLSGIPDNTDGMHQLFNTWCSDDQTPLSTLYTSIHWNRKKSGSAHLVRRVRWLEGLITTLSAVQVSQIVRYPKESWQNIVHTTPNALSKGIQQVLYRIAWLPHVYVAGSLLHAPSAQEWAVQQWRTAQVFVPTSIKRAFTPVAHAISPSDRHLFIDQHKSFCRPRRCADCLVFKDALGY